MTRSLPTLALLAGLLAQAPAHAVNYTETFDGATASNGAYGIGTIPGTGMALVEGNAWIVGAAAPHGNALDLGSGWYTPNFDAQTNIGSSTAQSVASFDLLAGHTYTLTFDWSRQAWSAGNGPFPTALTASFGSHSVTYNDVAGFFYGEEWKAGLLSFTPAADELGVHVVFTAAGPGGYSGLLVDNVAMVGMAPVPEPQALWLMAAGLGLFGLGRLRRRAQAGH